MPRPSWKSRTESLKKLSLQETIEWLKSSRVTPRRARWVYRRYVAGPYDWTASHHSAPEAEAMFVIRAALGKLDGFDFGDTGNNPGWVKPFLWGELYRHKGDLLGEEIAEVCSIFVSDDNEAAAKLMDLYEDESAHPFTRCNVLYALLSAPIPERLNKRLQQIVRRALNNRENPYARCTACMLSEKDPTITLEDIEPLLSDQAGLKPDWAPCVSDYAKEAYERLLSYERHGDPRVR